MEYRTAAQAAEDAKGLTFEIFWEAFMESGRRMEEAQKKRDHEMAELSKKLKEQNESTRKTVHELSKNIGGLGNSFGRFVEGMFVPDLYEKFNEIGFSFYEQSVDKVIRSGKRIIAEIDVVLENSKQMMLVEIKTNLTIQDIDRHMERIDTMRKYLDERGDKRILLGSVAGGFASKDAFRYAQEKGFYVVLQNGDAVSIAEMPEGLNAREW